MDAHEPAFEGDQRRLRAILDAQLGEDRPDVQLDRSDRDPEPLCNRRIRARLREHHQDGTFARGELGAPFPLPQAPLGFRRDVPNARPGAANGGGEIPPDRGPHDIGRSTGIINLEDLLLSVARTEGDHPRVGKRPAEGADRGAGVLAGQARFDEDDVRAGLRRAAAENTADARRFLQKAEVPVGRDERANAPPRQGIAVHHRNPYRVRGEARLRSPHGPGGPMARRNNPIVRGHHL